MSFRLKTVLGIACIEALLLTILVISGLHYLSTSNAQQLLKRAATTAKLVATMTGDAVVAVDLATLDALVDQALRNPDLIYLRIRLADGTTLSQGGDATALALPFTEDETAEDAATDKRLDISAPITIADTVFGQVELGLSTAILESTFDDAFTWMVGIALSEMGLVALLGLALGHYLTRQLMLLKRGARQVAGGEFGYQIPIEGNDELADTAKSFNRMSEALARYAEIAEAARKKAEAGRELAESTLKDALNSMRDSVLVVGENGNIVLANESYRTCYASNSKPLNDVTAAFALEASANKEMPADYIAKRLQCLENLSAHPRWEAETADGRNLLIAQHPMSKGGAVIVQTDVSELYEALEKNRQLQLELMQKHKTEALGTLAGGIAHEINTPVQFISDNAEFVAEGVGDIINVMEELTKGDLPNTTELMLRLEAIDWPYLHDELPRAIGEMANGTDRVRDLIATFKQFASKNDDVARPANLVEAAKLTIEVTKNCWQHCADIRFDAPDDMPLVSCHAEQISQVLHSLITNAAHAIEDCTDNRTGLISMGIACENGEAIFEIRDNGCGIAEENLGRIYDVLFTTKEPGRGTGNGLALCHAIIVRSHRGSISVESELGHGTCVKVALPL